MYNRDIHINQNLSIDQNTTSNDPIAHLLGHDLCGVYLGFQQRKHLLHNCLITVSALLIAQLVATGDSRP